MYNKESILTYIKYHYGDIFKNYKITKVEITNNIFNSITIRIFFIINNKINNNLFTFNKDNFDKYIKTILRRQKLKIITSNEYN